AHRADLLFGTGVGVPVGAAGGRGGALDLPGRVLLQRAGGVIVLGIETSTPQTTVALGTERGTMASMLLSIGRSKHEIVIPAVQHVLEWSGTELGAVGGIAVGVGPGLFTGLRVGVQTAKSLAQVLQVP